jgi:hypothetical protein
VTRKLILSTCGLLLTVSLYGNYQLIARFNFMCGQVMGVVDGVYETTATDEAKFRLGTMADVCFVRGWDWSQAKSYGKESKGER